MISNMSKFRSWPFPKSIIYNNEYVTSWKKFQIPTTCFLIVKPLSYTKIPNWIWIKTELLYESPVPFLIREMTCLVLKARVSLRDSVLGTFLLHISIILFYYSHPFNLHPEKWFEGYPVKYTQIFIGCTLIFLGCHHALIFLGYSLDFFLIYKYET